MKFFLEPKGYVEVDCALYRIGAAEVSPGGCIFPLVATDEPQLDPLLLRSESVDAQWPQGSSEVQFVANDGSGRPVLLVSAPGGAIGPDITVAFNGSAETVGSNCQANDGRWCYQDTVGNLRSAGILPPAGTALYYTPAGGSEQGPMDPPDGEVVQFFDGDSVRW